MNYIYLTVDDVQASYWMINTFVFMYIHPHFGIINTHFSHISVWQKEQNCKALYKPNNADAIFMTKGAIRLGLWAAISVIMKQNIGRVQKNEENVQMQNTVCTLGTQQISTHFLLTALCSFVLDRQISLQPSDVKQQYRSESNFDSDIGSMPVSIKPMFNPMLTNHQRRSAPIYTRQFYRKCPWKQLA